MRWAAFLERSKKKMAYLAGTQNAQRYMEILRDYLLPFAARNHSESWVLQQDYATIHTVQFEKTRFSDNNTSIVASPARSPGLIPVETLWAMLA